ncbi:MAG: lysine--tRNA ligase [Candidatus Bathyarchaeia archaeon]
MAILRHWVVSIADRIEKYWSDERKPILVCNGGLSVSGLQHVGRLRGEIILVEAVRRVLEDRGWKTRHILVLYTQDPWKGKDAQLKVFKDANANRYIGWRLVDVPDPYGCCDNWVEHYWMDFGPYIKDFSEDVEVYTTTDLYRMDSMKKIIGEIIDRRRGVVEVLNKFRGRNPFPDSWMPFEPLCENCKRIDSSEAIHIDLDSYRVLYRCRFCGYEGVSSMENGKLYWRLEWPAIWKALDVGFEPYGKDHATPGGSRDSCIEIAREILRFKPPFGIPYEWVGYTVKGRDLGDMGSSDFIGFTPREWLMVAEPEVLRFYFLVNEPMKRVVLSLDQIYRYVDLYDRAERIFFDVESLDNKDELLLIKESYLLSTRFNPPPRLPFQLPYLHAVLLVQVLPVEDRVEAAIQRLKSTGILNYELESWEIDKLKVRLICADNWLKLCAPDEFKVKLLEYIPEDIARNLDDRDRYLLRILLDTLSVCVWSEQGIKDAMKSLTSKLSRSDQEKLFKSLYLILFGKPYGPRIAPFLSLMSRDVILSRLKSAVEYP